MNRSSRWQRQKQRRWQERKSWWQAGGNDKLAADRHTQQSTLSRNGNGGSNCDGDGDGNVDGYVDDNGSGVKRKPTKNGNVNCDGDRNGNVYSLTAIDAHERQPWRSTFLRSLLLRCAE